MKSYTVRKQLRASVQGTCSYSIGGTWITGKVWDVAETGWRTTTDRLLPLGFETIVFLALGEGEDVRHFLIESAMVRWSAGRHAGWEILNVGAVSQASFADILGRSDPAFAVY